MPCMGLRLDIPLAPELMLNPEASLWPLSLVAVI
jgi:hypothetical protein